MDIPGLPVALESVLQTLAMKCSLSSWDVHGKGKTTTLVLRWDSDSASAIGKPEPVTFARYRRKSPSELRRDTQRAATRQHQVKGQSHDVNINSDSITSVEQNAESGVVDNVFETPPSQTAQRPDYNNTDNYTQEPPDSAMDQDPDTDKTLCDTSDTDSENDEFLQYWEDRRDTVTHYLSSLKPKEREAVLECAVTPVVRKVVLDHRYGHHCLYALTDRMVFQYGLREGVVDNWFYFTEETEDTDLQYSIILSCLRRWCDVDPLRYADQIERMKQHIEACCHVMLDCSGTQ